MAFRAAQTGHLLLSTLHTNSAIAALPRLLDLQIEPALVASSLAGVLSQRLARRTCDDCRREYVPASDDLAAFFDTRRRDMILTRGFGCDACAGTGYRGRLIIADLWIPDDADAVRIARGAPTDEIQRGAARNGLTMADDAHARLTAGETTIEELRRVLPHQAITEYRAKHSGNHKISA
jgi:type IV pilus assembly protein PilB